MTNEMYARLFGWIAICTLDKDTPWWGYVVTYGIGYAVGYLNFWL